MKPWLTGMLFVGLGFSVQASMLSPWALIKTTTPGPPTVIGKVSNGCISGAERLPETGTGYVSVRRHRNRFYGHPDTLGLIRGLGEKLAQRTDLLMMVGDLSQPRGGRMSSMHRSHQNGMDVDIWLTLAKSADDAKKLAPEGVDPPSMLDESKRKTSPHWGEMQAFLIRTAAENPDVDRIFVNPGIKLALCNQEGEKAAWLGKLRPWWGHDAHFHVRLKCPQGSPDCEQQNPVGEGSGCDKTLTDWFKKIPVKLAKEDKKEEKKPEKKPVEPAILPQCQPVLAYRQPQPEQTVAKKGAKSTGEVSKTTQTAKTKPKAKPEAAKVEKQEASKAPAKEVDDKQAAVTTKVGLAKNP